MAPGTFPRRLAATPSLLAWREFEASPSARQVDGLYVAGLVRYLREHDIRVLEVSQPHAHTRRRAQ